MEKWISYDDLLAFNFETQCCRRRNALGLWRYAHISGGCGRRRVSPAARRLGVPKSIVSRRLARLEQALGVRLLSHGAWVRLQTPDVFNDVQRCASPCPICLNTASISVWSQTSANLPFSMR